MNHMKELYSKLFLLIAILSCAATTTTISLTAVAFTPTPLSFFSNLLQRRNKDDERQLLSKQSYFTQVISDVDDTLKSSGGVNVGGVALGGIDVQYKRGDFYPGVFQFMLELSRFDLPTLALEGVPVEPAKVAIVTARAEEFKVALELKDDSKMGRAFIRAGHAGLGPVLYGSVAEWIVQTKKGLRKFRNFELLLRQDNTAAGSLKYVYVGDTGELDQEAGETMLREYPELVVAVFLHAVSGNQDENDNCAVTIPPARLLHGRPMVFFRTYVGAAAKATQLGLMDEQGLRRVVDAAEKAMEENNEKPSSSKWRDLERDIADAMRTMDP